MSDDRLLLMHIQECLKRVSQYTSGGETEFLASTIVQDAVLRNLQTLAESTQRLSEGVKANYPRVDWRGLAGFRNILVHSYLGIDLGRVWIIVERDLPELQAVIDSTLAE